VEVFKPHWHHANCGGTVAGMGALFKRGQCEKAAAAIGAVLPTGIGNKPEYLASHPELVVQLLGTSFAPRKGVDQEFLQTKALITRWLIQKGGKAS
jgi:hypothetical protein